MSSSDRYSGGRPTSSAVLKKVESNVTAGTEGTLEHFTCSRYTWLGNHKARRYELMLGYDTDRSGSLVWLSQASASEIDERAKLMLT
jgi:hypothetical protein